MDFTLTQEQQMLFDTARAFCEQELLPHEHILEKTGELPRELELEIRKKSIEVGLHAYNMPENAGGPGLTAVEATLVEKGLGPAALALVESAGRPTNVLAACEGQQREYFLKPVMAGEKRDCIAMSEPETGSDLKGMKTRAVKEGSDWIINGTKHFISNARIADFAAVFVATGEEDTPRGKRKRISCFLVDLNQQGVEVQHGYDHVGQRGFYNDIIHFTDARVEGWQMVGAEGQGFEVVNDWLGPGRLTVAATCQARAERAFDVALDWAASREQFGQKIGKFQGVSFPLADMALQIRMGDLLLMNTAWKIDQNMADLDRDCAMAKLYCSEMLGRVSDQAIQTCGGMGLMGDLPLERIWRDARVERIWEGTSEIQRHIISRSLLRPLGA